MGLAFEMSQAGQQQACDCAGTVFHEIKSQGTNQSALVGVPRPHSTPCYHAWTSLATDAQPPPPVQDTCPSAAGSCL